MIRRSVKVFAVQRGAEIDPAKGKLCAEIGTLLVESATPDGLIAEAREAVSKSFGRVRSVVDGFEQIIAYVERA